MDAEETAFRAELLAALAHLVMRMPAGATQGMTFYNPQTHQVLTLTCVQLKPRPPGPGGEARGPVSG